MMKNKRIIGSIFLMLFISFFGIADAISFNSTSYENGILLNVTHEGEYQAFLNEEWKFNSTENEIIFSDLESNSLYKIRLEESGGTFSQMVTTNETHYAGISATVLILFLIWVVVLILGLAYIPLLIIIDVIPLVILIVDNGYGVDIPIMRVFFGMLIPATIILFGWRVKE